MWGRFRTLSERKVLFFHNMNDMRPRWFVRNLESALNVLPLTVVTGARQTGKTTLVKSIGPSRAYLTLDDVGVLDRAERHPDALLRSRSSVVKCNGRF